MLGHGSQCFIEFIPRKNKNKNLGSFLRFACIWIMLEKNPYQSSLGLGWDQSPCISLTEISELQPVCSALHSFDIVRCNVWQFNEALGKINVKIIRHFIWGEKLIHADFTHLFSELQPVCSTLHSIDIVRHVSFSAMCDNLMRLLGKSMPNLLDRCLGFCKRKLENEFLTETMKISTLTTSRKKYLFNK